MKIRTSINQQSSLTYKDSGVDVNEGAKAVDLMKKHVKSTYNHHVIGDLGHFAGLFKMKNDYKNPVLVSGTDGVGTKLKLAFMMDRHDTVGIDLVAMCANDILCQGAKPLFFLDYLATGKLEAEKTADIVKGVAEGCKRCQMALLGGETAEMPGFYMHSEYDLAGFAVGVCDEEKLITGQTIEEGDVLIGLPSSGVHSNGYSLVRKVIFEKHKLSVASYVEELDLCIGEALLEPTRIYAPIITPILETCQVSGMVHITGGGFYENIPRVIPDGYYAEICTENWDILPIFHFLQEKGNIIEREMFSTFNMGIGYIIVANQSEADKIEEMLKDMNEPYYKIGKIHKTEESEIDTEKQEKIVIKNAFGEVL